MPDINLAAETVRNRLMRRRQRMSYLLSVLVLIVVGSVWGAILVLNTNVQGQITDVEKNINQINAELKAKENTIQQINRFRVQLASLRELLGANAYWSSAFGELERLVTGDSLFGTLIGGLDTMQFTANVTVSSIDDAADLVASLERGVDSVDSVFSNVRVASLKGTDEAVVEEGDEDEEGTTSVGSYVLSLTFEADKEAFSGHDTPMPYTNEEEGGQE